MRSVQKDDPEHEYELAKLAVSPGFRERNRCIAMPDRHRQGKRTGMQKIFLESNTLLRPATALQKTGVQGNSESHPAYERVDIQMELVID